jgi:hypothetical protein
MTSTADFTPDPGLELTRSILMDAFDRVRAGIPDLVAGLSVEDLLWRPDPAANSIAWLLWHLSRVQDDHLAALIAEEQVWTSQGWAHRFGLPYDVADIGYGQTAGQVGAFSLADPDLLVGYHEAVHNLTAGVIRSMSVEDFDRIVDRRWDPPVTGAVRIVSVVGDVTQHFGQAAYVRGLRERSR